MSWGGGQIFRKIVVYIQRFANFSELASEAEKYSPLHTNLSRHFRMDFDTSSWL